MKTKDQETYTLEEMTGKTTKPALALLAIIGLLAIAVGTMLPILNVTSGPGTVGWWKYVYAGGALCFLIAKLFTPYTGIHPRVKRLFRIETWSALFFCVAAFFFFWEGGVTRDSWAFTLAGGVLIVFTTIAIPRTINKQLRRQGTKK